MPSVWSARNTLYKVALVVLFTGLPMHVVSILLPYWLELDLAFETEEERVNVPANYGLWQICLDSRGCHGVYAESAGAVGGWFFCVQLLMIWAFVLHMFSVLLGALQNFLSRTRVRTWSSPFWRRVMHRDCELPEDIGFAAGFLGQAAHIVFMLFTKEKVSDGATYSWSFGLGFLATGGAVLATLALTKARLQPIPRPPPPQVRPVELQDVNLSIAEPELAEGGMVETDFRSRDSGDVRRRESPGSRARDPHNAGATAPLEASGVAR